MRRNNATGQAQPWLILESLCLCGYFPRADRRQWSGAGGPGREEMFPSAERQSCGWTGIGSRRNERSIRCQVEVAQRDFNPMSDRTNGDIPTPSLSVELSGPGKDVLEGLFTRKALSCGAVHFERVAWSTEVAELPPVGETIASTTRLWGETRLVSRPGAVVLMSFHSPASSGRHGFDAFLAAADRLTLDNLSAELLDLLPEASPPEDRRVEIRFWAGGQEATAITKRLAVEPWTDIEANYAASTRDDLAALMRDFRPGAGGKLLLWHGEPGTGKTYALRTLAWEWRDWCDFHYVIDPEVLLGPSSPYLLRVLLNDDTRLRIARETSSRWRLLILEDCGELLSADAKAATGQALSRLLNLTDGLIGEGFKTLVLISTNDPLRQMHPAVTREGREAARATFARHSNKEARDWLRSHGVDDEPDGGMTLAGLYAAAAGRKRSDRQTSVGFSAGR